MAQKRRRKTAQDRPPRITWLRVLALIIGLAVFLLHAAAIKPPGPYPHWLYIHWNDLLMHFLMLFTFAFVYRLSFTAQARGANLATLLVCSGWGAACEIMQHWIPARDFSVIELAANILAPAVVVALWWVVKGSR